MKPPGIFPGGFFVLTPPACSPRATSRPPDPHVPREEPEIAVGHDAKATRIYHYPSGATREDAGDLSARPKPKPLHATHFTDRVTRPRHSIREVVDFQWATTGPQAVILSGEPAKKPVRPE